ncbi:B3 domain-containing transcription factor VRN1 [Linum grandiflorum]
MQRLSPEFVAEYGDLISDEVMLEVSDGKVWKIGLAKELGFRQQRIWLKSGFPRFLDYYAIEVRFLLLFKFIGSSRFRAFIFDLTACEIVYPISSSSSGTRPPEPQHSMDLDMDGSDSDSNSDFNLDDPVSASSAGKNGGGSSSSRPPQNVVDLTSLDSDSDSSDSDYDARASRSKGKQPVRSGKKPLPPPMTAGASYAVAGNFEKKASKN